MLTCLHAAGNCHAVPCDIRARGAERAWYPGTQLHWLVTHSPLCFHKIIMYRYESRHKRYLSRRDPPAAVFVWLPFALISGGWIDHERAWRPWQVAHLLQPTARRKLSTGCGVCVDVVKLLNQDTAVTYGRVCTATRHTFVLPRVLNVPRCCGFDFHRFISPLLTWRCTAQCLVGVGTARTER